MDIQSLLKEKKALLEGHFKLSSGLHSPRYVQCALLLQYPDVADMIGKSIASFFNKKKPDAVVSPALGGVIIGQSVAKALNVRALFTERQDTVMTLRRGFSVSAKEKILVVEDVITTGKSTGEVIAVMQEQGADIIGVGCIIDRSKESIPFPGIWASLLKIPIEAFTPENCPLCAQGIPVMKPGSRK